MRCFTNRIVAFIAFIIISVIANSQTIDDIGKIMLSVKVNDKASTYTKDNKDILFQKLILCATQQGYSTVNSRFCVSPNITITSTSIAEGGMKNVHILQGELFLAILDENTGATFASTSISFKASGTDKNKAIRNAIYSMNYSILSTIYQEAKEKILNYYLSQKNNIFNRADVCVTNGNFEEAITCLMTIPEELTQMHSEALQKAIEIYQLRDEYMERIFIQNKTEENNSILVEAKNLLAMHQPQNALKVLWDFQSGISSQDVQYELLIRKAEAQITDEEREAFRLAEREYQDQKIREKRSWQSQQKEQQHRHNMDNRRMDLRQQKVSALKSIACEYLKNNPGMVDYINVRI